jgi:hypothetical protein
MSPLQKIAMGLVIVFGTALFPAHPHPEWKQYDGLADPVGWILVLAGLWALAHEAERFEVVRWPAGLAAVISIPAWFPQLTHRMDDSGLWALSLPQIAFCLLLARAIAEEGTLLGSPDTYVAKRFGLLTWGFVLAAILPPIAIGGAVTALDTTTIAFNYVVDIAFVYYLFRVHRRTWLGGPGPLEVHPPTREGRSPSQ